MMYLGAAASGDGSRLIPFQVAASARYMIELGHQTFRIWNGAGTLRADNGSTPYLASELDRVQFIQLNNVAFFCHPNHPPQILRRTWNGSAYVFTWSAADFSYPPFQTVNQTTTTATLSLSGTTVGSTGTVTFSTNIFTGLDTGTYVGSQIQLQQRRDSATVEFLLTGTGAGTAYSSEVLVIGAYGVNTYGAWDGEVVIEHYNDATAAWETIQGFSSNNDRNLSYSGNTDSTTRVRLKYVRQTTPTGTPRAVIELGDSIISGRVTIDSISGAVATVTVAEALAKSTGATTDWALSSWLGAGQYPRAITFHEQRLWFGGTKLEPNTFWASKTDDFLNFRRGANDDDALMFTLAAQEGSAIQSLLSHEALIIFTETEEWTATTGEYSAITPTNIFVRRQSRFGSGPFQAFLADRNIIFRQRGGRKLREYAYSLSESQAASTDLTVYSEHLVREGIRSLAFAQQPDAVLWIITNTGNLLSLTYDSGQNVVAWASHPTTGAVESIATIYGDDGNADEIWLVVNRTNGRGVERLDPDFFDTLNSGDITKSVFLDAAKTYDFTGGPSASLTGLDHLNGRTVTVLANGNAVSTHTVSGGAVTLAGAVTSAVVGLPFTSLLQPSRWDLALEDGTAQGRKLMANRIVVEFWRSAGAEYADALGLAESAWFPFHGMTSLVSDRLRENLQSAHRDSIDVAIRAKSPYPCNILSLIAKLDVFGT